ncbi:MAG TPA: hypothetical protein VFN35_07185, partial [Ktedonobacteraceae bacterium]|nr:hypothetical protein [Ktedonobacteraceae bacterium]
MKRRIVLLATFLLIMCVMLLTSANIIFASASSVTRSSACFDPGGTKTLQGVIGGANYTIAVPSNWNRTLLLYSHGYAFVGTPLPNPAPDASDPASAAVLLAQGYALAGSSYSQNGWALQQAFHDQIALLDFFKQTCGHPTRVIPWGDSLGGIITAGLVQLYPHLFAGALPMCGVLAGGVGTWNQALDGAFAFNLLLAGGAVSPVHLSNPQASLQQALTLLNQAQQTPQGRARIALSSALSNIPGWFSPGSPRPGAKDFAAQEQNQFLWQSQVDFLFAFLGRAELEARAGGNPSWNVGVNYTRQLLLSSDRQEVEALYKAAGLNLKADLHTLNAAPRISADPKAAAYLSKYITFNGDLDIPVLTLHTTGDGLVVNQNEQSYQSAVFRHGDSRLLRQVFVERAGHCAFTPAEKLTALQTLIRRLNTGRWDDSTNVSLLNQEATALGPALNTVAPAFLNF